MFCHAEGKQKNVFDTSGNGDFFFFVHPFLSLYN